MHPVIFGKCRMFKIVHIQLLPKPRFTLHEML